MRWRAIALVVVTVLLPAAFLLSYQQRFGYGAFIVPAGLLLFLGLPVPASWQGRSLLQPPAGRMTYHQTRRGRSPCFAVVEHVRPRIVKYLRCGSDDGIFREEVYDLSSDPTEKQNLLGSIDPPTLARLRRADARRARILSSACHTAECVD